MSSIETPQQGEREYFRAFGVVALFIAASPSGTPCLIGHTRDLGSSLESIRARWHWSIGLTHAWWLASPDSAMAIIEQVSTGFPADGRGRFEAEADAVAGKIGLTAGAMRVALTAHADAMQRVCTALAHVDGMLASANADGELGWFNRAFRDWRSSVLPAAAAALPYGLARSRLRTAVVRRIAAGGEPVAGPDLLVEVLPGISKAILAAAAAPSGGGVAGGIPHTSGHHREKKGRVLPRVVGGPADRGGGLGATPAPPQGLPGAKKTPDPGPRSGETKKRATERPNGRGAILP